MDKTELLERSIKGLMDRIHWLDLRINGQDSKIAQLEADKANIYNALAALPQNPPTACLGASKPQGGLVLYDPATHGPFTLKGEEMNHAETPQGES